MIDRELYAVALLNLLQILLRTLNCSRILLNSFGYDPEETANSCSCYARTVTNLGPQWVVSLKWRARCMRGPLLSAFLLCGPLARGPCSLGCLECQPGQTVWSVEVSASWRFLSGPGSLGRRSLLCATLHSCPPFSVGGQYRRDGWRPGNRLWTRK